MYSWRQIRNGIRRGVESPNLFMRHANRIYYSRRYGMEFNRDGVDVMAEDWDTLVILDACRFDLFEQAHRLDGHLERRTSRGSHTIQFLKGNFDGRSFPDTVYTTSTPQLERRRDDIDVAFHDVTNVWNTDRWDDEEGTVRPADMTDAAIESHRDAPRKRHIVHYMQPHYPFIGSRLTEGLRGLTEDEGFDVWEARMRGDIDVSAADIWTAYRANFEAVIESVERLLDHVDGRVVVSSDHGNMIGDRSFPIPNREWGHPTGLYTDELVTVPWFVVEPGPEAERRSIDADRTDEDRERVPADTVTDRLGDLGYVE